MIKNASFFYFLILFCVLIVSIVMFYNHWYYFGFLMAVIFVGGIFNYYDMKEHTNEDTYKRYKSRRAVYFNKLDKKQKETHLNKVENELEKLKK